MKIAFLTENVFDYSSTFIRRHIDEFSGEIAFIGTLHREKAEYKGIPVYSLLDDFPEASPLSALRLVDRLMPGRFKFFDDMKCRRTLEKLLNEHHVDRAIIEFGWMAARVFRVLVERGIPYLSIFHGEDVCHQVSNPYLPYTRRLRSSVDNSVKTLFVSSCLLAKGDALRCEEGKIELFYLGVPIPDLAANPGENAPVIRVCNVGKLTRLKGQWILVEASRILKERNYRFILEIYGDGPMKSALQEKIDKYGLADYVRLRGALEHSDILKELSASHVYAHSSITLEDGSKEALGLAILEAMSVGLPVVSTRNGGIPEIVDESTGVLVDENDPAQMAEALARLMDDPGSRAGLGHAGRLVTISKFDQSKQNARLREYMTGLVPEKQG